MIKQGIIERVPADDPPGWISPAGWVPKDPEEKKLRLVFDAKELNKNVPLDSSYFPTPGEVMENIKADSKFFIKADLLQGYH